MTRQDGWNDGRTNGSGPNSESSNSGSSRSRTTSELARKLLKPEEILKLPDDACLIFHLNHPPILARRIKYYDSPLFRGGGTGSSPSRAGLAAGLLSAAILLSSVVVAMVAAILPALMPKLQLSRPKAGQPPVRAASRPGGTVTPPPSRVVPPPNPHPPANRQGRFFIHGTSPAGKR
jgi:hypothetical protein